ncbi:hypothetical protein [Sphingobacterium gobiense]|nr:hypothetical protein [Sphingobacterium gobiense]
MLKTLLTFLLLNWASLIFSQTKLLIGMDDLSETTYTELKNKNIETLKVIYGVDIYPKDPLKADLEVMKAAIVKAFPDKNEYGYGMLDWEGKAYHILAHSRTETKAFKDIRAEFIRAISFAKKLRPNVKWGFFEIPFRDVRFSNKETKLKSHSKILELLRECDVLYPSMYGYTPNYIGSLNDVSYAISLASELNKEVFPMVWHRYQGDNNTKEKRYWFEVIPKNLFVNRIRDIRKVKYNGKQVDGIVWWGKDTYFYEKKNRVVRMEAQNINDFKTIYNNLVKEYAIEIVK